MSDLTDLVPPLGLCKKIPPGEFKDSALVRRVPNSSFPLEDEFFEIHERDKCESWMKDKQIPAPTLQEILAALPPYAKNEQILACCVPDWADFDARVFGENWRVGYTGDCSINDKNPATAALKLWLKLKGIEK